MCDDIYWLLYDITVQRYYQFMKHVHETRFRRKSRVSFWKTEEFEDLMGAVKELFAALPGLCGLGWALVLYHLPYRAGFSCCC